jgi:hypothetical protein
MRNLHFLPAACAALIVLGQPKAFIAGDFVASAVPDEVAPENRTDDGKAPVRDARPIEGFWLGPWGGGPRPDGTVMQPVMAELFIKGDHVELRHFRNMSTLSGTVRFDEKTKQMRITPKAEAGDPPTPKTVDYTYDIKGDVLTLTDGDKFSISFQKVPVAQDPLANAQVEIVVASGINQAGDLLVTEFTELRMGRVGATYFRPHKRSLKTKQATVLLAQEGGLKKITLDQARGLIRESTPVVVAYWQDDRPSPPQLYGLLKEVGSPATDSDAVRRTLARILKPGTLVFILSAQANVPVP